MEPKNMHSIRKNLAARKELTRAHSMIALLGLGLAAILSIGLYGPFQMNGILTVTALGLITVIIVVSLGIVWRLNKK